MYLSSKINIAFENTFCLIFSCFGVFKKKLKESATSSLYDVADVCDNSGTCNFAVLVGSHDMKIRVPTFDLLGHLRNIGFTAINAIKEYYHFRMSCDESSMVTCLKSLEDKTIKVCLVKNLIGISNTVPPVIPPNVFVLT